jgi:hypothetical protein
MLILLDDAIRGQGAKWAAALWIFIVHVSLARALFNSYFLFLFLNRIFSSLYQALSIKLMGFDLCRLKLGWFCER